MLGIIGHHVFVEEILYGLRKLQTWGVPSFFLVFGE